MTQDDPHYHGHRNRLRGRFLDSLNVSGESQLPDYELLELILYAGKARGDVKPLAKQLIAEFGSLGGVLEAQPPELERVEGIGIASVAAIKAVRAAMLRGLSEPLKAREVLSNWKKVLGYLEAAMGRNKIEQFRVLFLDKKNQLLSDEVQQEGTIDHTPVYPREVVKRALELGASALILAHNHPSGDCAPSQADLEMTRQIVQAAAAMGILVHDHVIISAKEHYSFASHGQI